MPFSIQNANGVYLASLQGALDPAAGVKLIASLKTSVNKGCKIILDFAQVSDIDPAALSLLMELQLWCATQGSSLILAGLRPAPKALLLQTLGDIPFSLSPSVQIAFQNQDAASLSKLPSFSSAPLDDESWKQADHPSHVQPSQPSAPALQSLPVQEAGASNPSSPRRPQGMRSPIVWNRWDDGGKSPPEPAPTPVLEELDIKPPSHRRLAIIVAFAALAAWGGFQLAQHLKEPEIIVEPDFVEVNLGQELPDVRVTVLKGQLAAEKTALPDGLTFDSGEEFHKGWDYFLTGAPRQPGQHVLQIHGVRGTRRALPATLTLVVKERMQADWVFHPQSLPLIENKPIPATSYTKIVNGVNALTLRWLGEPVSGLRVEQKPAGSGSWRITGRPEKAGKFKGEFSATRKDGKQETRAFEVEIRPRLEAPVIGTVAVTLPPGQQSQPSAITPATPRTPAIVQAKVEAQPAQAMTDAKKASQDQAAIDDRMRTFLMERIEKANLHFTEKDNEMLRTIVSRLRRAVRVASVSFGHNEHEMKPEQVKATQGALKNPAIAPLLSHPDCQLLVVGYASMTGSQASNIRLSQRRARSVNDVIQEVLGRSADLCGDYGPTDIVSGEEGGNRVVEIYAGLIELTKVEEILADSFKQDFNRRHGGR
jgi:outer membrane protein OmpA-like peptidoglycan-associated protein/ABC-type transporter Mla MlaB component